MAGAVILGKRWSPHRSESPPSTKIRFDCPQNEKSKTRTQGRHPLPQVTSFLNGVNISGFGSAAVSVF